MYRHFIIFVTTALSVIGCTENDFPQGTTSVASKPAVNAFLPDPNVNYDPFDKMSKEDRVAALGGMEGALSYFSTVAAHLAGTMHDEKARKVVYKAIRDGGKDDVKLSDIMHASPHFRRLFATGFKSTIADKGMVNALARRVEEDAYDEKALFQVLGAMVDIEVTLANSEGKEWVGDVPIAVTYAPIVKDGGVVRGTGADLNPIELTTGADKPPYPLLFINFDEDRRDKDETSASGPVKDFNLWQGWSFTTPAYAHRPNSHNNCHHVHIMYPAWEIMITNRHEGGAYPDTETLDLPELDVPNRPYEFRDPQKHRVHGPCLDRIKKYLVNEKDWWPNPDDTVACWKNYLVRRRGLHYLSAASGNCKNKDAEVTFNVTRF